MKKSIACVLLMLMCAPMIVEAQIDPSPVLSYVDATDLRMVLRKKDSKKKEETGIPERESCR